MAQNEIVEQGKGKLVEQVINRVKDLTTKTGFVLPQGYAVENALRAAYFMIGDTVDRNGKSALEVCTPASISESLFRMAAQALEPSKKQCYFIVRGNKLCMDRSYFGSIAIAKRVASVVDVTASVIYEGDGFDYQMLDGKITAVQHVQKIGNMDNEIYGAYCIVKFKDGSQLIDVMTIARIKKSWKMSSNQSNNKLQNDFSDDACKRTIINHCLKPIINSSDDANLFQKLEDDEELPIEETSHEVVTQKEQPVTIKLPVASKKEEKKAEPEPVFEEPETLQAELVEEDSENPFD